MKVNFLRKKWGGGKSALTLLSVLILGVSSMYATDDASGTNALSSTAAGVARYVPAAQKVCYALAAIIAIVSAVVIYKKINDGAEDAKKLIALPILACVFLTASATALPAFFGLDVTQEDAGFSARGIISGGESGTGGSEEVGVGLTQEQIAELSKEYQYIMVPNYKTAKGWMFSTDENPYWDGIGDKGYCNIANPDALSVNINEYLDAEGNLLPEYEMGIPVSIANDCIPVWCGGTQRFDGSSMQQYWDSLNAIEKDYGTYIASKGYLQYDGTEETGRQVIYKLDAYIQQQISTGRYVPCEKGNPSGMELGDGWYKLVE